MVAVALVGYVYVWLRWLYTVIYPTYALPVHVGYVWCGWLFWIYDLRIYVGFHVTFTFGSFVAFCLRLRLRCVTFDSPLLLIHVTHYRIRCVTPLRSRCYVYVAFFPVYRFARTPRCILLPVVGCRFTLDLRFTPFGLVTVATLRCGSAVTVQFAFCTRFPRTFTLRTFTFAGWLFTRYVLLPVAVAFAVLRLRLYVWLVVTWLVAGLRLPLPFYGCLFILVTFWLRWIYVHVTCVLHAFLPRTFLCHFYRLRCLLPVGWLPVALPFTLHVYVTLVTTRLRSLRFWFAFCRLVTVPFAFCLYVPVLRSFWFFAFYVCIAVTFCGYLYFNGCLYTLHTYVPVAFAALRSTTPHHILLVTLPVATFTVAVCTLRCGYPLRLLIYILLPVAIRGWLRYHVGWLRLLRLRYVAVRYIAVALYGYVCSVGWFGFVVALLRLIAVTVTYVTGYHVTLRLPLPATYVGSGCCGCVTFLRLRCPRLRYTTLRSFTLFPVYTFPTLRCRCPFTLVIILRLYIDFVARSLDLRYG